MQIPRRWHASIRFCRPRATRLPAAPPAALIAPASVARAIVCCGGWRAGRASAIERSEPQVLEPFGVVGVHPAELVAPPVVRLLEDLQLTTAPATPLPSSASDQRSPACARRLGRVLPPRSHVDVQPSSPQPGQRDSQTTWINQRRSGRFRHGASGPRRPPPDTSTHEAVPTHPARTDMKAGPAACGSGHLLVTNLETGDLVADRPSLPTCPEFCFGMNSSAEPTCGSASQGACRSPDLCRSARTPPLSLS